MQTEAAARNAPGIPRLAGEKAGLFVLGKPGAGLP